MSAPGPLAAVDRPDSISPVAPGSRSRFTRPAVTLPVVIVVLAAALAVVLIHRGADGPGAGEAIVRVDGIARVTRADGSAATVTGSVRMEPRDRIALRAGTATFELARGVRYEGRGRAGDGAGTELEMGLTPSLEAGPLLVTTGAEATTLRSSTATVRVDPGAAVRLAKSYALRLSTYQGLAVLDSAGAGRRVPALRAADAVGDGELSGLVPLRYDAGDRWDRRYLANAIYLDGQLGPLRRGIDATNLAPAVMIEAVRAKVSAHPSVASLDLLAADRDVDVDLAVGIAVVGSSRTAGPFAGHFGRGFAFHDDGAPWGLVAMDQRADPTQVLAALRAALDSRAIGVALATAGGSGRLATAGSAGPGGTAQGTTAAGVDGATAGAPGARAAGDGGTAAPGGSPGASPGATSPGATVPGVNVPGVPGVNVPGVSVPGLPEATLPPVRVPPVTVPPVALPKVTLPPVLVPSLSVPLPGGTTVTTPPVATPPVLGPVLGGLNGTVGAIPGPVNGLTGGLTGTAHGAVGGLGGLLGR